MTFVTSASVSTLAIDLLSAELSLTQTVLQVPSSDVAPPSGGTTILRVPVPRTARIQERGGALTYTEIDEDEVEFDVEHVYDAATVNEHQRTLDIVNFGQQVTRPQVRAVAGGAERQLADVMQGLPIDREVALDGSDLDNEVADAVADLDEAENPMDSRFLAVSPQFAARLTSPNGASLTDYQGEVATEALRRGILGEYRGLIVVKNPRLTGFRALAYHESAFAFANLTPADIPGTIDSATMVEEGIGIRHVFRVSADLETQSVLSTYAGASLVDIDRVVTLGQDDES
jgi:hypothetical protein